MVPCARDQEVTMVEHDALLVLEHVSKSKLHPVLKKIEILRDVSLAIRAGEAVGVVGPNGVGKTTLFKVALGLWRPDRGRVAWRGRDVSEVAGELRAHLGVVGELAPLYPYLSGSDHLEMKRRLFPAVGAGRVTELRDALQMGPFWTVPTAKLSQGQRQRVALATALLPDPPVLLLDEATNGLDPDTVRWLTASVRNLVGRGVGVCAASHVLSDLVKMVDRVVFLRDGTVVAEEAVSGRSAEWLEARYHQVMGLGVSPLT